MVKQILQEIQWCEHKIWKFNERDRRQYNNDRQAVILPGSKKETIIADWMEANFGFQNTLIMTNSHRVDEGLQPVGRNAIMYAFDCMSSRIDKIQKVPQGSSSHEGWTEARKNQTKQFLVMLDKITFEELNVLHPDAIPPAFDPCILP